MDTATADTVRFVFPWIISLGTLVGIITFLWRWSTRQTDNQEKKFDQVFVRISEIAKNACDYTDKRIGECRQVRTATVDDWESDMERRISLLAEHTDRKMDIEAHILTCKNVQLWVEKLIIESKNQTERSIREEIKPLKQCITDIDNSLKLIHDRQKKHDDNNNHDKSKRIS